MIGGDDLNWRTITAAVLAWRDYAAELRRRREQETRRRAVRMAVFNGEIYHMHEKSRAPFRDLLEQAKGWKL